MFSKAWAGISAALPPPRVKLTSDSPRIPASSTPMTVTLAALAALLIK